MIDRSEAAGFILSRHRVRLYEALPWIVAIALYFLMPGYRGLLTQILVLMLFALSLDLIVGYAGIVSLGHAAFFGVGAYSAALLATGGWAEPITGLLVGAGVAGVLGLLSGWVLLRTHGLTLLMLTMAVTIMLHEIATQFEDFTGGFDGLNFAPDAVFGTFSFDPLYYSVNYFYALAALFIGFVIARQIVHSPFGYTLTGIREKAPRMRAIGSPVHLRMVTIYTISAALAGVAGAVFAQVQGNVTPNVLSFEESGNVLIMIVLGGVGRLYGALLGAVVFKVLQSFTEQFLGSALPYWMLTVGLVLVLTVLFARRGLLGIGDDVTKLFKRQFSR